jgi:hypothetical protein
MSKEYPLYPELPEDAKIEAQALIDAFKKKLISEATEAISSLYCDVAYYIESDSWSNFRNELLAGLCNYSNRRIQSDYDFAKIRRAIFDEYKSEIIPELNQDLVKENDDLKKQIESLREFLQEVS